MKTYTKLTAILASLTLLTGCGALNTAEQSAEYNAVQINAAETFAADSAENDGSNAAAPEKADLNLGYLNSTAHLLAFVAAEEGYFVEEGLNVTLTHCPQL